MSIRVRWHTEFSHVVCFDFPALWQWDDLRAAQQQLHRMLEHVPHDVVLVFSGDDERMLVPGRFLTEGLLLLKNSHPMTAGIIIVTRNPMIKAVVRVYQYAHRGRPQITLATCRADLLATLRTQYGDLVVFQAVS